MLKVQLQKVFDNAIATRLVEKGAEWKDKVHYTPTPVLRYTIAENPAEYIRAQIENLKGKAREIYGTHTPELKPGLYSDDVLVEVRDYEHQPWLRRYILSAPRQNKFYSCTCWVDGKTGADFNFDFDYVSQWQEVRPIPQDNFTFEVEEEGWITTVTIKRRGE